VTHQILQNCEWCCFHIHISPIYPAVIRSQRRTQQPIPSLSHELSSTGLSCKTVTTLHVLVYLLAKVLFNYRNLAIRLFWILVRRSFESETRNARSIRWWGYVKFRRWEKNILRWDSASLRGAQSRILSSRSHPLAVPCTFDKS
jgi:hypothetical protein